MKRHLLYHVMPVAGNPYWRWNCRQIRKRKALFDGRRVVAVVTGPGLDVPELVQVELGPDFEYQVKRNVPELRETLTFHDLFGAVKAEEGVTFYAHAKGVSRPAGHVAHEWAELLYAANLDYWPLVVQALARHPLAGCLKAVGQPWRESQATWFYSGTFFWLRNQDVFRRDWTRIESWHSAMEAWPGLQFAAGDAACLFFEGLTGRLNCYDPIYFRRTIWPEFRKWQRRNRAHKTMPGSRKPEA